MLVFSIARTAIVAMRRDRASLALSFVLPIAFFSIFATVFGGSRNSTPKIHLIVVDEDKSETSGRLLMSLEADSSLVVATRPAGKHKGDPPEPEYTAEAAEAAVKAGDFPVALIVPKGFGEQPISFGPEQPGAELELLNDKSDAIAPQIVTGLLQKAAMTSMPLTMASKGMEEAERYIGAFTPEQRKRVEENLAELRSHVSSGAAGAASSSTGDNDFQGMVRVKERAVVGENKNNPTISSYAAAIGVMFLLFTASGAAGALLDEAESGALDRVLSSRVTMTALLAGKLVFNVLLAFMQLVVMFLWAWSVFKVDLWSHIPGFVVMGISTAFAVASFGILLASICRTRAQLGAVSTLVILIMSSIGGSMFPRFLMSESLQKAGLFTINAWAIDGFRKVFWYDQPVQELWPQVAALAAIGAGLFLLARWLASKWEYA